LNALEIDSSVVVCTATGVRICTLDLLNEHVLVVFEVAAQLSAGTPRPAIALTLAAAEELHARLERVLLGRDPAKLPMQ
jgi:hypothetical protein